MFPIDNNNPRHTRLTDNLFGRHHHRQMNRMVNSFFGGQGGLFGGGGFGNSLMGPSHMDSHAMMPFGGGFGSPFGGLGIGGNMFDMSVSKTFGIWTY